MNKNTRRAIRSTDGSTVTTKVPSENKRAKRRKKKKEKQLRQKEQQARENHEQRQKAVIDELKQVLSQRKSVSKLKLVDKPLCNYFKTYVIDAHTYKDPSALMILYIHKH